MGRCLRSCKGLGELEVMEKAVERRKRKVGSGDSQLSTSSVQLKTRRLAALTPESSASPASSGNSTCESVGSDHVLASCCSSNGSSEMAKENEVIVECFATSAGDSLDCRERGTTPLTEVQAESVKMDSTARPLKSNSRHNSMAEKMPSEAELEEFFAAAEKNLQQQFIDKYNYDIVKDLPLEGRYEWVQIQDGENVHNLAMAI
ncbi:cyclin-dependent kinase inhibitor 7 isoform X2 [Sesamum indicum]|uniref:Cyclin-dependent kinase inhibitor n=1 Tax=Sesamum indicum TaxID=4182 RepID=A0A6I9SX59_SESIN|nr:cyclin-dependent kinase inhibitor 7 isoform X2 [Sesamum indicum]